LTYQLNQHSMLIRLTYQLNQHTGLNVPNLSFESRTGRWCESAIYEI